MCRNTALALWLFLKYIRAIENEEKKAPMADVKLNPDSDDVGMKFKIIGISVTLGLNAIVFIWFFSFQVLAKSCL